MSRIIKLSKKQQSIVELAKNVANQSTFGKFHHGAVLVSHGKIVNTAHNDNRLCNFGTRFRNIQNGTATLHAELGSILNVSNKTTNGSTVYVVRVNKQDEWRNSKPCPMCESAMKFCGISKVIYSTDDGNFIEMKL
jgi:deoxycytidylate deaminase